MLEETRENAATEPAHVHGTIWRNGALCPVRSPAPASFQSGRKEKSFGGINSMLWTIAIILVVLWLLGAFVFHVAGALIHILIVIAVIVVIYNLITKNRG